MPSSPTPALRAMGASNAWQPRRVPFPIAAGRTQLELLDWGRMGSEVHLWRVGDSEQLIEVGRAHLDLESRLQD